MRVDLQALLAAPILLSALAGCYRTVGPVVTDVHLGSDGKLEFVRCNLQVSRWWVLTGDDSFKQCVDQAGRPQQAPPPLHDVESP